MHVGTAQLFSGSLVSKCLDDTKTLLTLRLSSAQHLKVGAVD